MLLFALTATSAVVPSICLILFFHYRDVYREPARVLWATFGLGVLTIPAVLLAVWPLDYTGMDSIRNPYLHGFAEAFGTAAIPEEFFKWLVVLLYCARHQEFDEPMDGIVYGAVASLGFATLENVAYVAFEGGLSTALLRAFTAVPGHAFSGVLMGYFIGQAKFGPQEKKGRMLALSLLVPITLHGLYDFGLMAAGKVDDAGGSGWVVFLLLLVTLASLVVEIVWGLRLSDRLAREQLIGLQLSRVGAGTSPGPPGALPPPVAAAETGFRGPPAPVSPAGLYPPGARGRRVLGYLLLVPAFLLAAVGGLAVLGVGLALLASSRELQDYFTGAVVAVVLGLIPLGGGVLLLFKGVRLLNEATRIALGTPLPPAVPAPS